MPMPGMKTLKGIGRRKSGTPGLDDAIQTPISSFRVIPRDENNRKSVGAILDKPLPVVNDHRRTWYEEDASSSNRYVLYNLFAQAQREFTGNYTICMNIDPIHKTTHNPLQLQPLTYFDFRGSGSSAATSARSRVFDRTSATVSASSLAHSPIEPAKKVAFRLQ
jgi:hypothetical protein